jgi:putative ABC transport system permease protein
MAGVYRGMVDDARVLLDNSGADLWVVQKDTLGPYAEPSSVPDDAWRSLRTIPGVAAAANITYLTMQVGHGDRDFRALVTGVSDGGPGTPGWPPRLVAGRHLTRGHYEVVADEASGLSLDDVVRIRRNDYRVVGLTRRMVSSNGDPMLFIAFRDAQQAQFQKDNDALVAQRRRTAQDPALDRPGVPGLREAVAATQTGNHQANAVLVRVSPGTEPAELAARVRRWTHLGVHDRAQMDAILIGKLIATAARQIGMFLAILAVVSAAVVAFIIYTLTMGKVREIAVLKLIGTRDRTIAGMILQQAIALGLIGFAVGKIVATFWGPHFPKYVLLLPQDALAGLAAVVVICTLSSLVAIRAALKVDPAEAIGG